MLKQSSPVGEAIYDRVRRSGAAGLTDEELSADLRLSQDNIRHRRHQLVKLGLVIDCGMRRPTILGRAARVWMARDVASKLGKPRK